MAPSSNPPADAPSAHPSHSAGWPQHARSAVARAQGTRGCRARSRSARQTSAQRFSRRKMRLGAQVALRPPTPCFHPPPPPAAADTQQCSRSPRAQRECSAPRRPRSHPLACAGRAWAAASHFPALPDWCLAALLARDAERAADALPAADACRLACWAVSPVCVPTRTRPHAAPRVRPRQTSAGRAAPRATHAP
jgi:hypothetical protein